MWPEWVETTRILFTQLYLVVEYHNEMIYNSLLSSSMFQNSKMIYNFRINSHRFQLPNKRFSPDKCPSSVQSNPID